MLADFFGRERRTGDERRKNADRRTEIRFEPNKPNRRLKPYGRRSTDDLHWGKSSV